MKLWNYLVYPVDPRDLVASPSQLEGVKVMVRVQLNGKIRAKIHSGASYQWEAMLSNPVHADKLILLCALYWLIHKGSTRTARLG